MKLSSNVSGPSTNQSSAENVKASKVAADPLSSAKKGGPGSSPSSVSAANIADSSKVELSSNAQSIKKAKELATPSDTIDEAKVARLQKLIDDGKYQVDASAVADSLVDEHFRMP